MNLDGKSLTIDAAVSVANGERVKLKETSLRRMEKLRSLLERKLSKGEVVYGVNTGFGSLSERRVSPSDIGSLQLNLIRSHAAGVGDHMPDEVVRAAIAIRLNSLLNGNSGVRPEVAETMAQLLNKRVTPHVPEFGSLGASGDLVPSAHMALTVVGEGRAEYRGKCMDAAAALSRAQVKPLTLKAKEGLSLINGTCFTNALACVVLHRAIVLLGIANTCVALVGEATGACSQSFDPRLVGMKKDSGQDQVAKEIMGILSTSERIRESPIPQDPYSVRCAPQVHGSLKDALDFANKLTEDEMNSVSDNPVIMDDGTMLHGGNFHAQPLALAMDMLAIALASVGVMSLARVGLLLSRTTSEKKYMANRPGLESGLMILQYTSTALAAENSKDVHPVSAYPANVSAGIEDHASHGVSAGLKALAMTRNISRMLAIELICASNLVGKDLAGYSGHSMETLAACRKVSPLLDGDRAMSAEIEELASLLTVRTRA